MGSGTSTQSIRRPQLRDHITRRIRASYTRGTARCPTTGTQTGGVSLSNAYDDAARTTTQTTGSTVVTLTYDANGINTLQVTKSGPVTTTTTWTIMSTATACQ